jgi:hypothetical protein
MALGDQSDFTSRLLRLLPTGWFPSVAPRLNAALQGAAASLAAAFTMLSFVKAQSRIQTASGSFLDLISQGYFGGSLPRLQYEADADYAGRIEYNLTAPRGTRDGMTAMLHQLTGNWPRIFQPNRPGDAMCLASIANPNAAGSGTNLWSNGGLPGGYFNQPYANFGAVGLGYSAWGSLLLPCQVFIIIAPPLTGIAVYSGYDGLGSMASPDAGGDGGLASLASPDVAGGGVPIVNPNSLPGEITESFIYQQIYDWMPAGYSAWVLISSTVELF